jgi:hypothetical protein
VQIGFLHRRPVAAGEDGIPRQSLLVLGMVEVEVQTAALRPTAGAFDDELRD